jgi:hypothetical protein
VATEGGGSENAQFDKFYSKRGYRHEFLAPRIPQQNEIVERNDRTSQELARTMLNEFLFQNVFGPRRLI